MRDIEKELKAQVRTVPSEQMDRKMDALFAAAAIQPEPLWRRPVAVWQCMALCMVCVGATLWGSGVYLDEAEVPKETVIREVVYVVPEGYEKARPQYTRMDVGYPYGSHPPKVVVTKSNREVIKDGAI